MFFLECWIRIYLVNVMHFEKTTKNYTREMLCFQFFAYKYL